MGQTTIGLLFPMLGTWSWLPFWLIYILVLSFFIYLAGGIKQVAEWLAPSKGGWAWAMVACIIPVVMTLPIFVPHWRLLFSPQIFIATLLFVAVNPLVEEFYWRGALLDATKAWPGWLSISYSVLGFALHHLWIGVIAAAGRHPSALAGPVLMGAVWAITYKATGSLRWPILGHILANLFSLSVPVFLNLYVAPGMPGS
jgi:membrane protease YdiL (CAAX protease family)